MSWWSSPNGAFLGTLIHKIVNDIESKVDANTTAIANHVDDCQKVPKVLILERIESIKVAVDNFQASTKEFRLEVKEEFKDIRHKHEEFQTLLRRDWHYNGNNFNRITKSPN